MEKINSILKNKLYSKDKSTVLEAIKSIRQEGNYLYIKLLANKLTETNDAEISNAIIKLFNDLTDESAPNEIIDLLKDEKYLSIQKILVSSCWQSRLNFIPHFIFFVEIAISSNYETAIESISVIDNFDKKLPVEQVKKAKQLIIEAVKISDKQKGDLLQTLYSIIDEKTQL